MRQDRSVPTSIDTGSETIRTSAVAGQERMVNKRLVRASSTTGIVNRRAGSGMFEPIAETGFGPSRETAERESVIEKAFGRQGEPVNEGVASGVANATVGDRRKGEKTNEISSLGLRLEDDPRVAADGVVVLSQDEPGLRDDLQDGVHRRTQVPVRLQVRRKGLTAVELESEPVHISALAEPAIDA